jgi:hypothetical protein
LGFQASQRGGKLGVQRCQFDFELAQGGAAAGRS